jgi:hypothetical protein
MNLESKKQKIIARMRKAKRMPNVRAMKVFPLFGQLDAMDDHGFPQGKFSCA